MSEQRHRVFSGLTMHQITYHLGQDVAPLRLLYGNPLAVPRIELCLDREWVQTHDDEEILNALRLFAVLADDIAVIEQYRQYGRFGAPFTDSEAVLRLAHEAYHPLSPTAARALQEVEALLQNDEDKES